MKCLELCLVPILFCKPRTATLHLFPFLQFIIWMDSLKLFFLLFLLTLALFLPLVLNQFVWLLFRVLFFVTCSMRISFLPPFASFLPHHLSSVYFQLSSEKQHLSLVCASYLVFHLLAFIYAVSQAIGMKIIKQHQTTSKACLGDCPFLPSPIKKRRLLFWNPVVCKASVQQKERIYGQACFSGT